MIIKICWNSDGFMHYSCYRNSAELPLCCTNANLLALQALVLFFQTRKLDSQIGFEPQFIGNNQIYPGLLLLSDHLLTILGVFFFSIGCAIICLNGVKMMRTVTVCMCPVHEMGHGWHPQQEIWQLQPDICLFLFAPSQTNRERIKLCGRSLCC